MAEKIKRPSKAELAEMDDFGQWASWRLEQKKKEMEAKGKDPYKNATKQMIDKERKRKTKAT